VPALSIARQQQALDCLDRLGPANLEVTDSGCAVDLLVQAEDSEAARNDGEFAVARALSSAGHTMNTAPISVRSVHPAPPSDPL
jgi:hypothetical protein